MPDLEIRAPREPEWPAVRMLLPEAFRGAPGQFLLAFERSPAAVLGAASFRRAGGIVYWARLRIVRTRRRQRIGSRLLGRLIEDCRAFGDREIRGVTDAQAEPDAEPFLRAHGFERLVRLLRLEGELDPIRATLDRIRDRLAARGAASANLRVAPLREAPPDAVVRLYAEHIAHNPEMPPEELRAAIASGRLDRSVVLLAGGSIEGMMLGEPVDGNVARIHAWVVAPRFQGGLANALLLPAGLDAASAAGATRVRFESLDSNRDTLRVAERLGASAVAVTDLWSLKLDRGC